MSFVILRGDRVPIAIVSTITEANTYSGFDVEYHTEVVSFPFDINERTPLPPLTVEQQIISDDKILPLSQARQWFVDNPGVLDFIRLTPTEQEAQIDLIFSDHSVQQRQTIKATVIAISALIRERYL